MIIRYRRVSRLVERFDRILDLMLKITVFPIALIAAYAIYDYCLTELDAERAGRLATTYVKETEDVMGAEVDFAALKQVNSEIVA